MAANIDVYSPPGTDGLSRTDLEEALEAFFGDAAEDCGPGSASRASISITSWPRARILMPGRIGSSRSWRASACVRGPASTCSPTAGSRAWSGVGSRSSARIGVERIARSLRGEPGEAILRTRLSAAR